MKIIFDLKAIKIQQMQEKLFTSFTTACSKKGASSIEDYIMMWITSGRQGENLKATVLKILFVLLFVKGLANKDQKFFSSSYKFHSFPFKSQTFIPPLSLAFCFVLFCVFWFVCLFV